MSDLSLTKQAGFLMAGRFLSMPLAFLVPIVLARKFSLEEFGYYKQLFLIFNVLLPVIDLGITNSLYYFIPRFSDSKNSFIGQTIILTSVVCILSVSFLIFSPKFVSLLFTHNESISNFIPLLGLFAISWHFSNLLEVVLVVEKRALGASAFTFFSESARSILSVLVVIIGKGLVELLMALVLLGGCRCLLMMVYLLKRYKIDWQIKVSVLINQLQYSIPFGMAVVVNGFVNNSHQYIVSISTDASQFAIFAVGCFQLPLISVAVDSVAKTSLVRMTELRSHENSLEEIAQLISNSCRKLWLLFFPVFVFLWVVADKFIILLFTRQYIESVPVFRVFIFIVPLSAILLQHVPRAFNQTKFILLNNLLCLFCSVLFCWIGLWFLGIVGVAIGFVFAHLVWKFCFLVKCGKILQKSLYALIPVKEIGRSSTIFLVGGFAIHYLDSFSAENDLIAIFIDLLLFSIYCAMSFKYFKLLTLSEKKAIVGSIMNLRIVRSIK